jgi:hypothetical protein
MEQAGFTGKEKQSVYKVDIKGKKVSPMQKAMLGENVAFRTYTKKVDKPYGYYKILVVKEDKNQMLGWRVYEMR